VTLIASSGLGGAVFGGQGDCSIPILVCPHRSSPVWLRCLGVGGLAGGGAAPLLPYLGHLTGTEHIACTLGAEQEHRRAGGLLTQLPYHLHQHLHKGTQDDPWLSTCPFAFQSTLGPPQTPDCGTPSPALTERDSVETVSTIRGPFECRCNSSWDFSTACGQRGQLRVQAEDQFPTSLHSEQAPVQQALLSASSLSEGRQL
jgi:hypothetical protein